MQENGVETLIRLIDATSLVAGSMIGSEFYRNLCHGERYWFSGWLLVIWLVTA
jgi:hypothetical protein